MSYSFEMTLDSELFANNISVLYIRAQGIRPRCTAAVETYCATLLVILNTFAAGPPSRPCYPRDPLAAKGGIT